MKQRIPTQFLQINLARSDEIKNWAERLVKISNESINHDSIPRLMGPPIGINRLTSSYASGEKASGGAIGTCGTATPLQSRGLGQSPSAHAQASQSRGEAHATLSEQNLEGSYYIKQIEDQSIPPPNPNQHLPVGEVKKADTLNYRTLKPEKDGLFCERIFGPTSDWVCACGQTKERGASVAGGLRATDHERALRGELPVRICPLCGVEATTSRFRRYRMGYIGLACPVTHIWYLNSRPNLFAILLKMPTKYIKKIVYYKAYSPSLGRLEYLSPCLRPGGDFFDNEWEYLHRWLASKSSSHDILASWNFVQAKENIIKEGNFNDQSSGASSMLLRTSLQSFRYAPTKWLAAPPLHFFTMPEFPNWLENTGAQALVNQLETKNWIAEIKKLENSLGVSSMIWAQGSCGSGASQRRNRGEADVRFAAGLLEARAMPASQSRGEACAMPEQGRSPRYESRGEARAQASQSRGEAHATLRPIQSNFDDKKRKIRLRQLKLLKTFQKSGFPTTQMIFSNLPVLPPELRPIIQLGGGQLASSDVNDLYRRVISRNNRLKYYLYETHFVEFLVRSEQQLVQLAVDALLENGKTTQVRHTSGQKRLYRSLTDRIGGKQGRFRMNLLGKRVDYSGRSVIVVGPNLDISNCGLPYEMAGELFQPFLLRHLLELNLCKTIRAAKNILRLNKAFARQCMHSILGSHPILLNRAPTLHRLGIQAFHPILVFGRAIHLHPLVCPAFNADFDGDQMAVHIPLSPSAQMEARLLMLASGNWLSASTGQPNLLPSQDMVLGFYYVTLEKPGFQKGKGQIYPNLTDAVQAYESGDLDLHSQIWVYLGPNYLQEKDEVPMNVATAGSAGPRPGEKQSPRALREPSCPTPQVTRSKLRWTTKKAQVQLSADVLSRKNTSRSHHEAARKSKQRLEVDAQKAFEKRNLRPQNQDGEMGGAQASPSEAPLQSWGLADGAGFTQLCRGKAYAEQGRSSALANGVGPSTSFASAVRSSITSELIAPSSDQPIQIRLYKTGLTTKIYPSYQWKEDVKKNISLSSIRTTPGRILLNQIIQKYL
jgi:DNA-directed RNA polymerase beta' subunit